jgi:hypothetical protein
MTDPAVDCWGADWAMAKGVNTASKVKAANVAMVRVVIDKKLQVLGSSAVLRGEGGACRMSLPRPGATAILQAVQAAYAELPEYLKGIAWIQAKSTNTSTCGPSMPTGLNDSIKPCHVP